MKRRTVVAAGLWVVFCGGIAGRDLAEYRKTYEEEIRKIEDTYLGRLSDCPQRYLRGLDSLAERVRQSGNLDGWQAVTAEKARFVKEREIEESDLAAKTSALRALQEEYLDQRDALAMERARSILDLVRRYATALDREKADLTRQGKITDALAVKSETEQVLGSALVTTARETIRLGTTGGEDDAPRTNGSDAPATAPGNVALASRGTLSSAPANAAALNDGNVRAYTADSGYASGPWPCEFSLQFPKPYDLSLIRILLWNLDKRHFLFKVDVSVDGSTWDTVADRSRGVYRGWQDVTFAQRAVKFVRLTGLRCSANATFQVVEIEAYCDAAATDPKATPSPPPAKRPRLPSRLTRPDRTVKRVGD
jgi:hypothetical protein